jgi:hypothetical protein
MRTNIEYMRETLDYTITIIPLTITTLTQTSCTVIFLFEYEVR